MIKARGFVLPLFVFAAFVGCKSEVRIDENKDTTIAVPIDTSATIANDRELSADSIPLKPAATVTAPNPEDLPIRTVGELIISDKIKSLKNDTISFMLLDSLLADSRQTRDFYFKVFNKLMDRSGGNLSDAIGDYALSYVERYPNEFLANSKKFSANRLGTWASNIGIELFLSAGDVKEAYDKTTQSFVSNCKGCQAQEFERLSEFNKLIWTTIVQNKVEQKPDSL